MAELFLHITLVDFGRGGKAGPQRVPGKQGCPFGFRKIAPHAGRQRRLLDEARHLLVVEPIRSWVSDRDEVQPKKEDRAAIGLKNCDIFLVVKRGLPWLCREPLNRDFASRTVTDRWT